MQLAVILRNGIDIQPGDTFPTGWDLNRNRIFAEATADMLEQARNSSSAKRQPAPERPSDWSGAS
jgi:hypothetical protein